MWSILCGCVLWYYLYKTNLLNLSTHHQATRNVLSALHASSVVLFYKYATSHIYYVSLSYYLVDLLHELNELEGIPNKLQLGMMLHHILIIFSTGSMFDPQLAPYYYHVFYLAELSNFPLYAYYHMKNMNYQNHYVMTAILFLQSLSFAVLRLGGWAPSIYHAYSKNLLSNYMMFASIIVYILSATWCYMMAKKFMSRVRL